MRLEISVTPRVHEMFYHIKESLDLTGRGLGPGGEQPSELLHQERNKC